MRSNRSTDHETHLSRTWSVALQPIRPPGHAPHSLTRTVDVTIRTNQVCILVKVALPADPVPQRCNASWQTPGVFVIATQEIRLRSVCLINNVTAKPSSTKNAAQRRYFVDFRKRNYDHEKTKEILLVSDEFVHVRQSVNDAQFDMKTVVVVAVIARTVVVVVAVVVVGRVDTGINPTSSLVNGSPREMIQTLIRGVVVLAVIAGGVVAVGLGDADEIVVNFTVVILRPATKFIHSIITFKQKERQRSVIQRTTIIIYACVGEPVVTVGHRRSASVRLPMHASVEATQLPLVEVLPHHTQVNGAVAVRRENGNEPKTRVENQDFQQIGQKIGKVAPIPIAPAGLTH